jgi:TIR domain
MTDIFFSYSSKDRDRVRAVHAALAAQGFGIFWDQSVPPGMDWDTWIRQHLNEAKCAIVFWSNNSVGSDNVRHEATLAKQQGKLVPVLLDPLAADQFPMGLYWVQGANLTAWAGDEQHDGWLRLRHEVESKLTPLWVRRQIDTLEAELVAERARREGAERRDRTLREQIAKEAQAQQELTRERDEAREELSAAQARLDMAERAKPEANERQRLMRELEEARAKIAALEGSISEMETVRARESGEAAALKQRLQAAEAALTKTAAPPKPTTIQQFAGPGKVAASSVDGRNFRAMFALAALPWRKIESLEQARTMTIVGAVTFALLAVLAVVLTVAAAETANSREAPTVVAILLGAAGVFAGCCAGTYFNSRVASVIGFALTINPWLLLIFPLPLAAFAGVRGTFATARLATPVEDATRP